MRSTWFLVLLGVMLLTTAGPAVAQSTFTVHPHADLLFTDIREVQDLAPLGEGYAAATKGGLVLWWGEGARNVMTRLDGLPSNLVWAVDDAGDRLLVGTEFGAALVDPLGPTVEPLDAPEAVLHVVEDHVLQVEALEDGRWVLMDRDGEVAVRHADGTWEAHDAPSIGRPESLYADEDHLLLAMSGKAIYRLTDEGAWDQIARTQARPRSLAVYEELLYVGLDRGGLLVLDLEGDPVDVDLPDLVSPGRSQPLTILTLELGLGGLWAGTPLGYAAYDAASDRWRVTPDTELPQRWVQAILPLASEAQGAEKDEAGVGTLHGVGWPTFEVAPGAYSLHTTANGPLSNQMRGLAVKDDEVWVATQEGLGIYLTGQRTWANVGEANGLPFPLLNEIDVDDERGIAWMAALGAVVGLDLEQGTFHVVQDQSPITSPHNVYFDVEVDGRYLWMPEYLNGLVRYNVAENRTDRFDIKHGLLSRGLTCAERWHEFLVVCAEDIVQVFNRSLATQNSPLGPSHNLCSGPRCDNYPADGTFTALADGPRLWLGTMDAGLVLVERDLQEGVKVTGHWSRADGLHGDEVRALWPAPGGIWAGGFGGLTRVDIEDGVVQTWGSEEGLDDPSVNGLAQVEDTLYASTLSGLYRVDLGTGEFLPLHEVGGEFRPPPANLRISYPPAGSTLFAPVNMTGTLSSPVQAVDGIEVRIDDGAWAPATGTNSWRFRLPVDELALGAHTAYVRAVADGETVVERNRTFQVGEFSGEAGAPTLEHQPPGAAQAGQPLEIRAEVAGQEPLAVTVQSVVDGTSRNVEARVISGEVTARIPIPQTATGEVAYRFHVQSGTGDALFPSDDMYFVPIEEPRVRALSLTFDGNRPDPLSLAPGGSGTLGAWVSNHGNGPEQLRVEPSGLRSSWLSGVGSLIVPPGERVGFNVTVTVPEEALPVDTLLLTTVQSTDGRLVESLSIPVHITGSPDLQPDEDRSTPGPAAGALLAPVLAALLAAARQRRWPR